jgi:hypothetical protein
VKRARTAGRPSFFGTTLKGLELSGGKFDSQTFMTAYGVPDHPKLFIIKLSTNQSMECKDGVGGIDKRLTLAGKPTRCSPCFVKATTDSAAILAPSAFKMTRASLALHDCHT